MSGCAMEWGPMIDHDGSGQPVPRGTIVRAHLSDKVGPIDKLWTATVTTTQGAIWRRKADTPVARGKKGLRVVRYQIRQPVAGSRHAG